MSKLRMSFLASAAAIGLAYGSISTAHADYVFSGSGTNGNLTSGSEPWLMGLDGSGQAGWGSPGVSQGVTTYTQAMPAYGLIVNFSGGGSAIDPGSIAIGNEAGCAGSSGGGSTFCNISAGDDIWEVFQTGPDSLDFLAQSPTVDMTTGETYFVNVLFTGSAVPTSFTGEWLTEFTPTPPSPSATPLPATLPLFAGGLGITGLLARRKRRKAAAVA